MRKHDTGLREHVPVFNGDWSPPSQELASTTFEKTNPVIKWGLQNISADVGVSSHEQVLLYIVISVAVIDPSGQRFLWKPDNTTGMKWHSANGLSVSSISSTSVISISTKIQISLLDLASPLNHQKESDFLYLYFSILILLDVLNSGSIT